MKVMLIPIDGGNPVEVRKDLLVVGRQADCDLLLDHKTVSKLHCVLAKTDGVLQLRDLGSTNGCRVNGRRVMRAALTSNDILTIASFKYRVCLETPSGSPAPPPEAPKAREMTMAIDRANFATCQEPEEEEDSSVAEPIPVDEPVPADEPVPVADSLVPDKTPETPDDDDFDHSKLSLSDLPFLLE